MGEPLTDRLLRNQCHDGVRGKPRCRRASPTDGKVSPANALTVIAKPENSVAPGGCVKAAAQLRPSLTDQVQSGLSTVPAGIREAVLSGEFAPS
jgi:hypothetical protein